MHDLQQHVSHTCFCSIAASPDLPIVPGPMRVRLSLRRSPTTNSVPLTDLHSPPPVLVQLESVLPLSLKSDSIQGRSGTFLTSLIGYSPCSLGHPHRQALPFRAPPLPAPVTQVVHVSEAISAAPWSHGDQDAGTRTLARTWLWSCSPGSLSSHPDAAGMPETH